MHRLYTQIEETQRKRADTGINVDNNNRNIGNEIHLTTDYCRVDF